MKRKTQPQKKDGQAKAEAERSYAATDQGPPGAADSGKRSREKPGGPANMAPQHHNLAPVASGSVGKHIAVV